MVSEKKSCHLAVHNSNNMMSILKNLVRKGGNQTLKNLGLIAAQCKGIAACVHS